METKNKQIVVFDVDNPQLLNNAIFVPEKAEKVHRTLLPISLLYEEALKENIELMTPDVYLGLSEKPSRALLISDMRTSFTKKLLDAGLIPLLLVSEESPLIASRFYAFLKKYSSP